MIDFSIDDAKFIKLLANSDATILENEMDIATKMKLNSKISLILQEYYNENTLGLGNFWVKKFEKFGIKEDEGKAALACARRLGIDIY